MTVKLKDWKEDISCSGILFWNCSKGISYKRSVVKALLNNYRPRLAFISESEIKINLTNNYNFFNMPNYDLELANTISTGKSRIACYVEKQSGFVRRKDLESSGLDIIVMEGHKMRIVGIYRPFKLMENETKGEAFDKLIKNLRLTAATNNQKDFLAGGDFNVDWLKPSNLKMSLMEWMDDFDFNQIVKTQTRYRAVTTRDGIREESSLLDHLYTNMKDLDFFQLPTEWSDHEIHLVKIPRGRPKQKKTKIHMRDWRAYNPVTFGTWIKANSFEAFNESVTAAMEKQIPFRVVRFHDTTGEVADPSVAKIIKKRDRFLKKYKKLKDVDYLFKAQHLSKRIKQAAKKQERFKLQKKLQNPDPRSFWTTVRSMLGHSNRDEISLSDGQLETTDKAKNAETFLNFFLTKVEDLEKRSKLADTDETEAAGPDPDSWTDFTHTEIVKSAKALRNKKSFGQDNIPLKLVRDIGRNNPHIICGMLNGFAREGLPQSLKVSRIIPLHKKGEKNKVENYRPIANLNSISKLYEKLILCRLNIETEGKEGSFQHAYRKNHSTVSALLELQSRIGEALDKKELVVVYSMDLSAAFDLLRPQLMQKVLAAAGVSNHLKWIINDFLTNRQIYLDLEGTTSSTKQMNIGCVQGSILGPRLFTLYLGDLVAKIGYDEVVTYADDSYVIIRGKSITELQQKVKEISTKHVRYLRSKGMIVNENKTEIVIFGNTPHEATFEIEDTVIKSTNKMKALGVWFQHDMKWNSHVDEVLKKIKPKLSMLKKIRKNLDMDQFLKIATAQIYSILYYASQVWLNETLRSDYWQRLKSLHYRVLRAAARDFKQKMPKTTLDKKCKRVNPKTWSTYSTSSLVIKVIRDRSPTYLYEMLHETIHTTRRQPTKARFYDNSKGKIGKHRLCNRLQGMNDLPEWLNLDMTDDAIRRLLKKALNFDFE